MADEKDTAKAEAVDPEKVKVEELELSEQQLRMVSAGKGMGRIRNSSLSVERDTLEPHVDRLKLDQVAQ